MSISNFSTFVHYIAITIKYCLLQGKINGAWVNEIEVDTMPIVTILCLVNLLLLNLIKQRLLPNNNKITLRVLIEEEYQYLDIGH